MRVHAQVLAFARPIWHSRSCDFKRMSNEQNVTPLPSSAQSSDRPTDPQNERRVLSGTPSKIAIKLGSESGPKPSFPLTIVPARHSGKLHLLQTWKDNNDSRTEGKWKPPLILVTRTYSTCFLPQSFFLKVERRKNKRCASYTCRMLLLPPGFSWFYYTDATRRD